MKRKASTELLVNGNLEIASNVTIIDPEGDLQMDFTKDDEPFGLLVNKQTLRLASSVFSRMLAKDSPFQESASKKDGIQVIPLKEDDSVPMEMIMNAIHFHSNRVPHNVSSKQLFALAEVCDKYDMGKSLEFWGKLWIKSIVEDPDFYCDNELIFIAITFGAADAYTKISRDFVMRSTVTDEGGLMVDEEHVDHDICIPQPLLGQ